MFDPKQLPEAFLGRGQQPAEHQAAIGGLSGVEDLLGGIDRQKAGTFAAGAATGGLAGLLLDSRRAKKIGGELLGYGGAAVLGGLAYKAWQNHQINQAAPAGVLAARVSASPGPAPVLPAAAKSAVDPSQGTAADRRPFDLALMRAKTYLAALAAKLKLPADLSPRSEGVVATVQRVAAG